MASSNGPSAKAKPRNIKNLTLPSPKLASKPASSAADAQVPGSRASRVLSSVTTQSVDETIRPVSVVGDLSEQMATLELGVEFKLDLRAEDLKTIERLGAGNGGTVSKVMHIPTKTIMAKKVRSLASKALTVGDPRGEEKGCAKANFERAADYARLQFALYRLFLWSVYG
jgi:mitogen-activated protein kinase kinase